MKQRKWIAMLMLLACWFPGLASNAQAQEFNALERMQIHANRATSSLLLYRGEGFQKAHLQRLESDIQVALSLFAPEDRPYSHARMLRDYGSTAGNPTGHLKALLTGNHCHFPIVDGEIIRGGAQEVYFCEYDGPASRNILVMVEGQ